MKPKISVLGAGRMGSALVKAFLKEGYKTSVWNRTKSKLEPLAALGSQRPLSSGPLSISDSAKRL